MTKYINNKTKVVIDVDSALRGDWLEVDSQNQPLKIEKSVIETETSEANGMEQSTNEDANGDEISKKDIMQELDAMGKEYNPRDKKEVLYALMMQQGE